MEYLSLLFVVFLISGASCQCEEDNTLVSDDTCLGPSFAVQRNLPAAWGLLLDTFATTNLRQWTQFDQDGTGGGFSFSTQLCLNEIRFCSDSLPNTNDQRNWIFSPYIRYPTPPGVSDVQELFLQVTFRFGQCLPPACTNRFIDVFRYDVDGPVAESSITNINNYQFFRGSQANSRLENPSTTDVTVTWRIPRPTRLNGNFYDGMYIGLRDSGNCGLVGRIILYYMKSPGYEGTLLTCPSIPLPLEGSGGTTSGSCCCGVDADSRGSLVRMCSNPGGCQEPADDVCGCVPGYEYNSPICTECPARTFQPDISTVSSCDTCPPNSEALFPGAGACNCTGATIRNPLRPRDPCAEAPSSPLLTAQPVVDGTFVRVFWGAALDSGGLDDLHYNVYIRVAGEPVYRMVNTAPITGTGELEYDVPGLDPGTSYAVVVTSANGATGDPETLDEQLSTVQGQFVAYFVVTGQPGLRREAALALTFFLTLLLTAVITGLIVGLVMWYCCLRNATVGTSPKTRSSATYATNPDPEVVKFETTPTSGKRPPPRPPTKPTKY